MRQILHQREELLIIDGGGEGGGQSARRSVLEPGSQRAVERLPQTRADRAGRFTPFHVGLFGHLGRLDLDGGRAAGIARRQSVQRHGQQGLGREGLLDHVGPQLVREGIDDVSTAGGEEDRGHVGEIVDGAQATKERDAAAAFEVLVDQEEVGRLASGGVDDVLGVLDRDAGEPSFAQGRGDHPAHGGAPLAQQHAGVHGDAAGSNPA